MICDYCHRHYSKAGKLKGLCPECNKAAGAKPTNRAPSRESYLDRLRREGVHRP